MNKNFGTRVENVWKDLRPITKEFLVDVLKTNKKPKKQTVSYDAHSDWELSRLLGALDASSGMKPDSVDIKEMKRLADICVSVLEEKTVSADIFIQLAKRALKRNDFAKIDKLADILHERFAAGEIIEVIRATEIPQISAIAYETLAIMPVSSIAPHIKDPLYFEIACNVLDQQANEFQNREAKQVLEGLEAGFNFNS
ncbi:MAG: hypothetical protein HKN25_07070 [Pyrinomonadaceae bacterium]|nr:hypothetical protein [Pyrinomonadaceae bacterium]